MPLPGALIAMDKESRSRLLSRTRAVALTGAAIAMLWAPAAGAKAKPRKKVPSQASVLTLVERAFHIAARADATARKALLGKTQAADLAAGSVKAAELADGAVGNSKLA